MVNVSKNILDSRLQKALYEQLSELVIANRTKKDAARMLFELLSPTERLMLAKRLAVIGMLTQEYSTYTIANTLKVSVATVLRVQRDIEKKSLEHIVKIFRRKTGRARLLSTVELLVTLGFPGVASKKLRAQMRADAEAWHAGAK